MDEFKHVFPGATEAGFKAAADAINVGLDSELNPVGLPTLGDMERLLATVQTTHDPSAALLAYGLAVGMLPGGRYLLSGIPLCASILGS